MRYLVPGRQTRRPLTVLVLVLCLGQGVGTSGCADPLSFGPVRPLTATERGELNTLVQAATDRRLRYGPRSRSILSLGEKYPHRDALFPLWSVATDRTEAPPIRQHAITALSRIQLGSEVVPRLIHLRVQPQIVGSGRESSPSASANLSVPNLKGDSEGDERTFFFRRP
ncbi:MAG: hypothetical protein FJX77_08480, partial [Armatimonadetes bacterium]|nr:hypothetical protein [Armatimonadota bacterium]